jgi:hypothetical protein
LPRLQPEPDEAADGFLPVKRWILCENPLVDEFELSGTEDRFQGVSLIPYHELGRRSCHFSGDAFPRFVDGHFVFAFSSISPRFWSADPCLDICSARMNMYQSQKGQDDWDMQ